MARTVAADTIAIKKRELKAMLRQGVREAVRDELHKAVAYQAEPWQFDPESPLYQALVEIREHIRAGRVGLLSHEEVWDK
jgi:hypothetical protein